VNKKNTNLMRMVVYPVILLPIVIFLLLVTGNRWLWPDMNNFISDAVGIQANWILIILALISLGGIYLLTLLYKVIDSYRKGMKKSIGITGWIIPLLTALTAVALSMVIFDEAGSLLFSKPVKEYTLPPVLQLSDGTPVEDIRMWDEIRRDEIIGLFDEYVYGPIPAKPENMSFEILDIKPDALDGKAIRKNIRVHFTPGEAGPTMDILIYLPKNTTGPTPLFLGMNFYGNHTTTEETDIPLPEAWVRNKAKYGITDNQASEESRSIRAYRWPASTLIEKGYGLATVYYGDLDPDFDDGFTNGVHPLFDVETGSISAWAWGLSRAMDYFMTDSDIDSKRVALMGHSRLGKAALWAGANDPRFAMVIANESGSMGAAISRRKYGEDVEYITSTFPHWFVPGLRSFADREEDLPVDQHMLLSLIAPRPLYVASAENDRWSDPEGEFLGLLATREVYELYGLKVTAADEMPAIRKPVEGIAGYHIREGVHDVTSYDWEQFLNFADIYLK
jgi:(4-O-methyl)-D-glucuronate---lignin esterase